MENEAQTAMRKLFAGYWMNFQRSEVAISASLLHLAETLERKLTDKSMKTYLAVMAGLSPEEIVLAFSRAATESKFFPSPATLREYSGRAVTGDPIANEAKEELFKLVAGMRTKHGLKLKPIWGKVKYGTEDCPRSAAGGVVGYQEAERHPHTVFFIARRTEAALIRLGWGDRATGIALIAEHPIVAGRADSDDERYQTNRMRAADDLLAKWIAAYREVSGDPPQPSWIPRLHQTTSYGRRQPYPVDFSDEE